MWPQEIAALAEIDAALGLPADGCNSTARTLAAIRSIQERIAAMPDGRTLWNQMPDAETVTRIKGPTIMLASGSYFDLENPESSEFGIEDIAHALAHICRYTGHCHTFYSVAQHSVLVSRAVPQGYAFHGLMHDAAEAFIGDVAKPLKVLLPDYKVIEDRIEAALFARFGLPAKLPQCVKDADRVLLRTEQRDLTRADGHQWSWTEGMEPLAERIEPMPPAEAKRMFLARYAELRNIRNMQIGGKYNWKGQPERLVYLGHNWSGNGLWHQFAEVGSPSEVWCEVLDEQLASFEETPHDEAEDWCDVPPFGWRCTRSKGHDGPRRWMPCPDDNKDPK